MIDVKEILDNDIVSSLLKYAFSGKQDSNMKEKAIKRGREFAKQYNLGRQYRDLLRKAGYKRARRDFTDVRRMIVKVRDNSTCCYCGKRTDEYHIDHIVPLSWGGSDYYHNIAYCCVDCNLEKHTNVWIPEKNNKFQLILTIYLIFMYNDFPTLNDFL